MLDRLTSGNFAALLNQTFFLQLAENVALDVELIEVTQLGDSSGIRPDRGTSFSIVFRSAIRDRYLPQGTYPVRQDVLGTIDMFLVPIGPDQVGMRYEAVFN